LSVGVVVDVLSDLFINGVALYWDVDSNTWFEVNDVRFEQFNLFYSLVAISFRFFKLLK
jgi:hypothetical protein